MSVPSGRRSVDSLALGLVIGVSWHSGFVSNVIALLVITAYSVVMAWVVFVSYQAILYLLYCIVLFSYAVVVIEQLSCHGRYYTIAVIMS